MLYKSPINPDGSNATVFYELSNQSSVKFITVLGLLPACILCNDIEDNFNANETV